MAAVSGAALTDPGGEGGLLGAGLPDAAERQLRLAATRYHQPDAAAAHLRRALALAPGHAAVLIGLYRFHVYQGRLADALDVARLCLAQAARLCRLPSDWRQIGARLLLQILDRAGREDEDE